MVIWRAYSQKVGDEQNKENDPSENQQCANLWHRGVWAPRFKQDQACSNSECPGLTPLLPSHHYTCVLPPEHSQPPPSPWMRERHTTHEREWLAGADDKKAAVVNQNVEQSPLRWEPATPLGDRTASELENPPPSRRWGMQTPNNKSHSKQSFSTPCGSVGRRTAGAVSAKVTVNRRMRGKQKVSDEGHEHLWTCNLCHEDITAPTQLRLREKRSRHLASRHNGVPTSQFHKTRKVVQITAASDLQSDEPSWTCIHCSKGLYLLKASKGKRASKLILTCAARKKPLGRIGSRGNALCLSMFAKSRFVQRNVRTQSMLPPKAKVKKLLEPLAMLSTLQTRRASGPNGFSPSQHVMFEICGCWCDICAIRKTEPLI